MSDKYVPHFVDPKGSIVEVPGVGILMAYGTAVPEDGSKGYATGCLFLHVDGGDNTALYCNEGTSDSSDFNAVSVP